MRFGLLGPVTAWTGDQVAELGPPKQRAVLAVLLLNAGRVVPVGTIADAVWGEDAPRTVRKNIQVYASRLRRLIGDGPQYAPPGYRLSVPPDAVDLQRFRELVGTARAAHRAGQLRAAAEAYRAAEALWRGAALSDLADLGRMDSIAAHLDEQRLQAVEDAVDVELELGRHTEVLPRLAELVAAHPLHERFAAQQVRALLRCGRRTEAYAAYLRCQRTLDAELGLAPGPELQRLVSSLRGGGGRGGGLGGGGLGGGLADGGGLAVMGWPEPEPVRQLPPAVDTFTGRAAELSTLLAELRRGGGGRHASVVSVVTGPPGVGKSTLAVQAAHQVADAFPDGQLYVNLGGATAGLRPLPPIEVLGRFLRALGVRDSSVPAGLDEASALWRSHLARRRLLVLLDNAADAAQVRPLITTGPRTAVVVTARRALADLDAATHLELAHLPQPDALSLLLRLASAARVPDRPELEAARRIVDWLGGLPLAIRIAGARLAARPSWSLTTLADRLADERRRLAELRLGDLGVRSSMLVSYQALADPHARRLLRLLGLLDGPDVALPVAAALLDERAEVAQDALDELVDTHLLQEEPAGRYRMHDLVRLFARERAGAEEPPGERDATVARVLRHYLQATTEATAQLGSAPALAWLEAERANLVAAVGLAAARDRDALARLGIDLAVALFEFFHARGHVHDWLAVNRLGCELARRLSDPASEAQLLSDLATGHFHRHRLGEAMECLHRALPLWLAAGDRTGQARVFNMRGVLHAEAGDVDSAIDDLTHSLDLREPDDLAGRASTVGNLGRLHVLAGRHDEAVHCLHSSAELGRRAGWPSIEANALANLGELHCTLGQHRTALRHLRRGLRVSTDTGVARIRASILQSLAKAHHGAGDDDAAIEHARQAVDAYREADFPHGEATALRDLGLLLRATAGPPTGEEELRQAHDLFAALGVPDAHESTPA